jgi:hypothetical protein
MFKLIKKFFRDLTCDKIDGLCLQCVPQYWELEGKTDFPTFLRALPTLVSSPSLLYLEDGSPSGELKEWLYRNMVTPVEKIAQGSYGFQSRAFHIPLTESTMRELAILSDQVASPELAIHVHVYELGRVILEWYDAFNNPIHVDDGVEESKVAEFACMIGFAYTKQICELDAPSDGEKLSV